MFYCLSVCVCVWVQILNSEVSLSASRASHAKGESRKHVIRRRTSSEPFEANHSICFAEQTQTKETLWAEEARRNPSKHEVKEAGCHTPTRTFTETHCVAVRGQGEIQPNRKRWWWSQGSLRLLSVHEHIERFRASACRV